MATLPSTPGYKALGFQSLDPTLADETHDGSINVRKTKAQRYSATLRWNKLTPAEFGPVNAFVEALRGRYTPFDVVLPIESSPQGLAQGATGLLLQGDEVGVWGAETTTNNTPLIEEYFSANLGSFTNVFGASAVDGKLSLTSAGSNRGHAYASFTTEIGKKYVLFVTDANSGLANGDYKIQTSDGASIHDTNYVDHIGWGDKLNDGARGYFIVTATSTTTYVHLFTKLGAITAKFDDVIVLPSEVINGGAVISDDCSSTTNWTLNANWTHDSGNTEFDHTTGSTATLERSIAGLTAGEKYALFVGVGNRTAGSISISLSTATDEAGDISNYTGNQKALIQFTANATTETVVITPTTDFDGSIQDLYIYPAIIDISTYSYPLAAYGDAIKAPVAPGADLLAYGNFSANNYFEQPYNSNLDFGVDDWCFAVWAMASDITSNEHIFCRAYYTGGSWLGSIIKLYFYNVGKIRGYISDDSSATNDLITSDSEYDDGEWHFIVFQRNGSVLELYVDGVKASDDTTISNAAGSLSAENATLRIGEHQYAAGSAALNSGLITEPRMIDYALTAAQIKAIYEAERHLFEADSNYGLYPNADNDVDASYVTVNGAGQSGYSINVKGFKGSSTGQMKANDKVRFAGHSKVYNLAADMDTDTNGHGAMILAQPLMESPADNEQVTVIDVPFTVRRTSDIQKYDVEAPDRVANYELDVVETW